MKTMGHQTTEEVVQKMIKVIFRESGTYSLLGIFRLVVIVYHYPQVADTDGSGSVEFEEFLEMICDQIEVG